MKKILATTALFFLATTYCRAEQKSFNISIEYDTGASSMHLPDGSDSSLYLYGYLHDGKLTLASIGSKNTSAGGKGFYGATVSLSGGSGCRSWSNKPQYNPTTAPFNLPPFTSHETGSICFRVSPAGNGSYSVNVTESTKMTFSNSTPTTNFALIARFILSFSGNGCSISDVAASRSFRDAPGIQHAAQSFIKSDCQMQ